MSNLRLSILDQSPISEGSSLGDALRNTIDLAQFADGLGYVRYWVAEHHGTKSFACASPEVLLGSIAAVTSRLRIGSGGIMLPHYSPFKVAETFTMLSGLYPGRIDLGIGRSIGRDQKVALALQRDRRQLPPDDFPEQLDELLSYFSANPSSPFEIPELWLLGSSEESAVWAAERSLPYVVADFINPDGARLAHRYQQEFRSSARAALPQTGVALCAVCAETDAEAERLCDSFRMMKTALFLDRSIPVPPLERAQRFLAEGGPFAVQARSGRRMITGTPERVCRLIQTVAEEYDAEEVFIVNVMHNHAARRRSYELLAEAFAKSSSCPSASG